MSKRFFFVLSRKWFDEISSGRKTVEYRQVKEYWATRLCDMKPGDEVIFSAGYTRRRIYGTVDRISVGTIIEKDRATGLYDDFKGDYFRIAFHVTRQESAIENRPDFTIIDDGGAR